MEALKAGRAKVEMAVMATTITMLGETSPARMDASPITRPPTMLTACPTVLGSRTPASRSTSNIASIKSASATAGKGMPSRAVAMLRSNVVGNIS